MQTLFSIARLFVAFMVTYFFVNGLLLLLLTPAKYAILPKLFAANMKDTPLSRRKLWGLGLLLVGGWGLVHFVPAVLRHRWLAR